MVLSDQVEHRQSKPEKLMVGKEVTVHVGRQRVMTLWLIKKADVSNKGNMG